MSDIVHSPPEDSEDNVEAVSGLTEDVQEQIAEDQTEVVGSEITHPTEETSETSGTGSAAEEDEEIEGYEKFSFKVEDMGEEETVTKLPKKKRKRRKKRKKVGDLESEPEEELEKGPELEEFELLPRMKWSDLLARRAEAARERNMLKFKKMLSRRIINRIGQEEKVKKKKKIKVIIDGEEEEVEEDEESEDEEEDEEKVDAEEEPIPLSDDLISTAYLSSNCTIPANVFAFEYSYGYDSTRYYNLLLLDERTAVFIGGNLLHFLDIDTGEIWHRRSAGGGGIGCIAKDVNLPQFAVGEKGVNPLIIIYEWPSMNVVSVLRKGCKRCYTAICFSEKGDFLYSHSGLPDYLISVWSWKDNMLLKQTKSVENKTYSLFSCKLHEGHFYAHGDEYMINWYIATSFTGMKIFRKDILFELEQRSPIVGAMMLQQDEFITGSDSGNLLYWRDSKLQLTISRRDNIPCHTAPITQVFHMVKDNEVYTVGMDGYIRAWDIPAIRKAFLQRNVDGPLQDEIEPCGYFHINKDDDTAKLMCIYKIYKDPANVWYIAQDAKGGVWKVQLHHGLKIIGLHRLIITHEGPIADLAASPHDTYFATLGRDGYLLFYNYVTQKMILRRKFAYEGCCMIWLPLHAEISGNTLVIGLSDGILRVLVVSLREREKYQKASGTTFLCLIQTTKPHSGPITALALNDNGSIFLSAGSDKIVFIYQITPRTEYIKLQPLGFVPVPHICINIEWKPATASTAIFSCKEGWVVEAELPETASYDTTLSYELKDIKLKTIKFKSMKGEILCNLEIDKIKKKRAAKRKKKEEKLAKIKEENPIINIEDEVFLVDSEEIPTLDPIHVPSVPNDILFTKYVTEDIVWLSVDGYDAGFMYFYKFDEKEPVGYKLIDNANDIPIDSFMHHPNQIYLVLGMRNGTIRVVNPNPDDYTDMSDYWSLPMHDNDNGKIVRMCYSYDKKMLFTAAEDSTIFSYNVSPDPFREEMPAFKPVMLKYSMPLDTVEDVEDLTLLSLQQAKLKEVEDQALFKIEQGKENTRKKIEKYRLKFERILTECNSKDSKCKLEPENLKINSEILKEIEKIYEYRQEDFDSKWAYKKERLDKLWDRMEKHLFSNIEVFSLRVYGFKERWFAQTFRQVKLGKKFDDMKELIANKLEEENLKGRTQEVKKAKKEELVKPEVEPEELVESFLRGVDLNSDEIKQNVRLQKALKTYFEKKKKRKANKKEWDTIYKQKPNENAIDLEDVQLMEEAMKRFGHFKLKSDPEYRVPREQQQTTLTKMKDIFDVVQRIYEMKAGYNKKVLALRAKKNQIRKYFDELYIELENAREGLHEKYYLPAPKRPVIDEDVECPDLTWKKPPFKEPTPKASHRARKRDLSPILMISKCPSAKLLDDEDFYRDVTACQIELPETSKVDLETIKDILNPKKKVEEGEEMEQQKEPEEHKEENVEEKMKEEGKEEEQVADEVMKKTEEDNNEEGECEEEEDEEAELKRLKLEKEEEERRQKKQRKIDRAHLLVYDQLREVNEERYIDVFWEDKEKEEKFGVMIFRNYRNTYLETEELRKAAEDKDYLLNRKKKKEREERRKRGEVDWDDLSDEEQKGAVKEEEKIHTFEVPKIEPTAWQEELNYFKIHRKISEQRSIINEMHYTLENFDQELKQIADERYELALEIKILEVHHLKLFKDLYILEDFEEKETSLTDRVSERLEEQNLIIDEINKVQAKVDTRRKEVDHMIDKQKQITALFVDASAGNKYIEFLKKIFKKKYKPPKVKKDDDESSSSSETSSDEDDEGEPESLDSVDMGPVRMDESICPEGLKRELYDFTFMLRAERHALEQEVIEQKKEIDLLKKEIEGHAKKLKSANSQLAVAEEELETYQKIKEDRLGSVEVMLHLYSHQLQYFEDPEVRLDDDTEVVAIPKSELDKLAVRMGEIDKETEKVVKEQELLKEHLLRLTIDTKRVQKQIQQNKSKIKLEMIKKFGMEVDLNILEEMSLRMLLSEMKGPLKDLAQKQDKEINVLKEKLQEKEDELCRTIQKNTDKLNLMTILKEEEHLSERIKQEENTLQIDQEAEEKKLKEYQKSVARLKKLSKHQKERIEALRAEIKMMSHKGTPLPPIEPKKELVLPKFKKTRKAEKKVEKEAVTDEEIVSDVLEEISGKEVTIPESETAIKEDIENLITQIIECLPASRTDILEILISVIDKLGEEEESDMKEVLHEVIDQVGAPSVVQEVLEDTLGTILSKVSPEGPSKGDVKAILNDIFNKAVGIEDSDVPMELDEGEPKWEETVQGREGESVQSDTERRVSFHPAPSDPTMQD